MHLADTISFNKIKNGEIKAERDLNSLEHVLKGLQVSDTRENE